jgi:ABC-2 type transport system ATP-binding protein
LNRAFMIVTNDLSKYFDDLLAVDGVNLRVMPGEVLALLGPNGAGKTTTVRMLTSVLRPTRGHAQVAGFDVVREAQKVRASVGVLTEQHGLYSRMPANEYLDFFGQVYGLDLPTRRARAARLLNDFGLVLDAHRKIAEYSKGMRQKLALARAMLHDPPVLLLDEPTSAMDPESARLVRDSIRELRSARRSIVICTHNLAEAEELADHIAIIRKGKIIASGETAELKRLMLGPVEYEVRFSAPLTIEPIPLPAGTQMVEQGADWFRFNTLQPDETNPFLLRWLLDRGLPVVSMQETPRSLEQVYLQAMSQTPEAEAAYV